MKRVPATEEQIDQIRTMVRKGTPPAAIAAYFSRMGNLGEVGSSFVRSIATDLGNGVDVMPDGDKSLMDFSIS